MALPESLNTREQGKFVEDGAGNVAVRVLQSNGGSASTAILQSVVSVTDAATKIPATALSNRKHIYIYNSGSATAYIGSVTVEDTDGVPLAVGARLTADIGSGVDVYGICSTGLTASVKVIEVA